MYDLQTVPIANRGIALRANSYAQRIAQFQANADTATTTAQRIGNLRQIGQARREFGVLLQSHLNRPGAQTVTGQGGSFGFSGPAFNRSTASNRGLGISQHPGNRGMGSPPPRPHNGPCATPGNRDIIGARCGGRAASVR